MYIVCDGHGKGGETCSQYVVSELPEIIKDAIESRLSINAKIIEEAISNACQKVHDNLDNSYIPSTACGTT